MRRFRRRRRRLAAAALLPVAATMSTSGLVAAAPGLAQEVPDEGTPGGEPPPAVDGQQVVVRVPGQDEVTNTGPGGKFGVRWTPSGPGEYDVQASAAGTETTTGSDSKSVEVTVYRKAQASWYGPGLYGNPTACGGTLTPSTLGVANKSLPCGTKLTLRYHGKSVEVEVIDRGPYAGDREFDLTAAVKQKLGFPSTGTVLASK